MRYFILVLLFLAACAPKPTKVTTENPVLSRKEMQQNKLREGTVILDVRAPFEFNVGHIPGAINVAWEDFSRRPPEARGMIDKDVHAITRRLALIGIDQSTNVLIVGKGKLGKGEEGRVAWTLESLGVQNIQLALHEAFRERKDTNPQIPNRNFWDATPNPELQISWTELKNKINGVSYPNTRARSKALQATPLPVKDENFVVIDVRPQPEFSLDNLNKRTPRVFRFENIDWREFFTDEMDPNPAIMKVLNEKGVTNMTEIYLISNHGVRSGAVTWALQKLGYTKARNFAAGYEQVSFPSNKKSP